MSDVARRETVNPDTVNKHHKREVISYETSSDTRGVKLKSSEGYQIMGPLPGVEPGSHE